MAKKKTSGLTAQRKNDIVQQFIELLKQADVSVEDMPSIANRLYNQTKRMRNYERSETEEPKTTTSEEVAQ